MTWVLLCISHLLERRGSLIKPSEGYTEVLKRYNASAIFTVKSTAKNKHEILLSLDEINLIIGLVGATNMPNPLTWNRIRSIVELAKKMGEGDVTYTLTAEIKHNNDERTWIDLKVDEKHKHIISIESQLRRNKIPELQHLKIHYEIRTYKNIADSMWIISAGDTPLNTEDNVAVLVPPDSS